jgi:dihydroorotate dehydrogenase
LLNGRWILHYAALGFDVLTYKTVRSSERACYPLPNLLAVRGEDLSGEDMPVTADPAAANVSSWAISFGMPSRAPAVWREDIERTRRWMGTGQVLVVSVVASPEAGWPLDRIADDFARCAQWAAESGAQAIEANLSCPNVCTQESNLYASPDASRMIVQAIRARIATLPLVLKVGLFPDRATMERFVGAVSGYADALSTTNSISAPVKTAGGQLLFGGAKRGIGGAVIHQRCLEELRMLSEVIASSGV